MGLGDCPRIFPYLPPFYLIFPQELSLMHPTPPPLLQITPLFFDLFSKCLISPPSIQNSIAFGKAP